MRPYFAATAPINATIDDSSADDGVSSYGKRWRHTWTVPHAQIAATGKVPVSVQLPPPEKDWGSAQSRTYWALILKAPAPGRDFDVEFQPRVPTCPSIAPHRSA